LYSGGSRGNRHRLPIADEINQYPDERIFATNDIQDCRFSLVSRFLVTHAREIRLFLIIGIRNPGSDTASDRIRPIEDLESLLPKQFRLDPGISPTHNVSELSKSSARAAPAIDGDPKSGRNSIFLATSHKASHTVSVRKVSGLCGFAWSRPSQSAFRSLLRPDKPVISGMHPWQQGKNNITSQRKFEDVAAICSCSLVRRVLSSSGAMTDA
jgi:hypothetical protein